MLTEVEIERTNAAYNHGFMHGSYCNNGVNPILTTKLFYSHDADMAESFVHGYQAGQVYNIN